MPMKITRKPRIMKTAPKMSDWRWPAMGWPSIRASQPKRIYGTVPMRKISTPPTKKIRKASYIV